MSDSVFPALLGQDWSGTKTPMFTTKVQQAVSGKELRLAYMTFPLWKFSVGYEVLRSDTRADLQTLMGFFLNRQGSFDSFLYSDPNDNTVSGQVFGVGDGIAGSFQVVRTYGGFAEPVQAFNGNPNIFVNDWEGNQLQYLVPRTNLAWWSADFSQATWVKSGSTVTPDVSVAPDGTTTVDRMFETSGTAEHYCEQTGLAFVNNTVVMANVFAAPQNTRNFLRLSILQRDNATLLGAGFNLTTGAVVSASGGVTAFSTLMPNGMYRCSIKVSVGTGGSNPRMRIHSSTDGSTLSYAGDITKGTNLWGANIQDATAILVPSSYIPTVGAVSAAITDYTLSSTGVAAFTVTPLIGAIINWSGSFYYRCRFTQDQAEFQEFLNNFWVMKKIEFVSVKL